jgi:ethanolamine ammonia-lyase large subunit
MTVDEVREIKERIYEQIKDFSFEELRDYYAKSTDKAEKRMAEIRKKSNLDLESKQAAQK